VTDKTTVTDVEKLDLRSHDIPRQAGGVAAPLPGIRTEGGKVDFERLKATLGETVDVGKERYGMTWPGKRVLPDDPGAEHRDAAAGPRREC